MFPEKKHFPIAKKQEGKGKKNWKNTGNELSNPKKHPSNGFNIENQGKGRIFRFRLCLCRRDEENEMFPN
jgi:hypothetical protein